MKTRKPKTIRGLRDDVLNVYTELRNGNLDRADAIGACIVVGRIVGTVRAQLEYFKLRKETAQIDFLKCH